MTDKLMPYTGQELKEGDEVLVKVKYSSGMNDIHNIWVDGELQEVVREEITHIIQKPNTSFETMEPGYHWIDDKGTQFIIEFDGELVSQPGVSRRKDLDYLKGEYRYIGPVQLPITDDNANE